MAKHANTQEIIPLDAITAKRSCILRDCILTALRARRAGHQVAGSFTTSTSYNIDSRLLAHPQRAMAARWPPGCHWATPDARKGPPLHSFTHSLTNSFTHSFTHSFAHSFIHSLTHSLTHSLVHSLTHVYLSIYLSLYIYIHLYIYIYIYI